MYGIWCRDIQYNIYKIYTRRSKTNTTILDMASNIKICLLNHVQIRILQTVILNTYTYKKVYKSNNNKTITNCIKMEYQSLCVSITCKKEIKDLTKFFARTHHFLKKKGGV